MIALTCVLTLAVKIPTPTKGYLNLGDCAVLLSGWLLGPVWGAGHGLVRLEAAVRVAMQKAPIHAPVDILLHPMPGDIIIGRNLTWLLFLSLFFELYDSPIKPYAFLSFFSCSFPRPLIPLPFSLMTLVRGLVSE